MNDWNNNGKYDVQDSYIDYHGANSSSSGGSSDLWKSLLLLGLVTICPPLGIIVLIIILLVK